MEILDRKINTDPMLIKRTKSRNGSVEAVQNFVKTCGLAITNETIESELPFKSTMLDIHNALSRWEIPSSAYLVSSAELGKIPLPSIACFSGDYGEFVLLSHAGNNQIEYLNYKRDKNIISYYEFDQKYGSAAVLIAQPSIESGEVDYIKNKKKEKITKVRKAALLSSGLLMLILIGISRVMFYDFIWQWISLLLVKFLGILATILILAEHVHANLSINSRLCNITGDEFSCEEILSSDAAKITSWLSWAEVGFFYFMSTTIVLLFYPSGAILKLLLVLNLLSLPFTFYSIFYQYKNRKWCFLCVSVQVFLWLEFFLLFFLHGEAILLDFSTWSGILVCFLAPPVAWFLAKPYLLDSLQLRTLKRELNSFKLNEEIFLIRLKDEKFFDDFPTESCICLGDDSSPKEVSLILSPGCPECARVYRTFSSWLVRKNHFKLQIILSGQTSSGFSFSKHITEFYFENLSEKSRVIDALNEWYAERVIVEEWLDKFPLKEDFIGVSPYGNNVQWINMKGISKTPLILFNGHVIPQGYHVEDLLRFL